MRLSRPLSSRPVRAWGQRGRIRRPRRRWLGRSRGTPRSRTPFGRASCGWTRRWLPCSLPQDGWLFARWSRSPPLFACRVHESLARRGPSASVPLLRKVKYPGVNVTRKSPLPRRQKRCQDGRSAANVAENGQLRPLSVSLDLGSRCRSRRSAPASPLPLAVRSAEGHYGMRRPGSVAGGE